MQFTAEQVWGLAVEADRINDGYLKEDLWDTAEAGVRVKTANKVLVKQWLREERQPSAEDAEKGREYRTFFNTYTLKALMGNLSDFDRQALRIAQMDEFTGKNMLEFAIVSCLPSVMIRDQSRNELAREVRGSTQLTGAVGDKIQGEIEVVKCYYSKDYDKFRVTAKLVDSFVDFWYNSNLEAGQKLSIKAKIKSVRGDNTTQLNFVKRA